MTAAEERLHELEGMTTGSSKTEMQRERKMAKETTQSLKPMEQLQGAEGDHTKVRGEERREYLKQ